MDRTTKAGDLVRTGLTMQQGPNLQIAGIGRAMTNRSNFIKKGELPRLKCFHNGIILIVICLKNAEILLIKFVELENYLYLRCFL